MAREEYRNIRLGAFVLIGTTLLVVAFYLIGKKQNLFGPTIKISTQVYNASGLMKGNNVRFSGIDVGTVESVDIMSDTAVNVVMVIDKHVQKFIKKDALASIGTDGLMGNKLVNIIPGKTNAAMVEDGDVLQTIKEVEMDEMLKTISATNENIHVVSANLRDMTEKFGHKNSALSVLTDTVAAENIKTALVNLKLMSNQSVAITGDLREITAGIKNGKGTLGALITDTVLSTKIQQTIVRLEKVSDTAAVITGDIAHIVNQLKQGKGSMGVLLKDTMLVHNLNQSIVHIDSAASGFDQNMEALQHVWPFKSYFKKQKKVRAKK